MTSIALTKMSSKGQVVIPIKMRNHFKKGEEIVIIENDEQLIMKRAKDFSKNLKEDLEFARRTEAAWKKYDKGEFISMDADDFLKEIEKW